MQYLSLPVEVAEETQISPTPQISNNEVQFIFLDIIRDPSASSGEDIIVTTTSRLDGFARETKPGARAKRQEHI
jgi:hypothetical protein